MAARSASTLRAITYRISSTPFEQLPSVIPHIATSLLECASFLSSPESARLSGTSEALILHKFETRVTTLLNDKCFEARWAAAVLIKATIDVGGWETLQACQRWVRGLLSILAKSDPPATKQLCIIVLSRIFMLTQEYPNLIREITTPSLPAFITACLNMVAIKPPSKPQQLKTSCALLATVLESFRQLLPHHPTVFRPFLSHLQTLLLPLLCPTPSSTKCMQPNEPPSFLPPSTVQAARVLFSLLHFCAPKSSSTEDWSKTFDNILEEAHGAADKIFRAIIEDWQSVAGIQPTSNDIDSYGDEVEQTKPSTLGLPGWFGIYGGCERLSGLLELLNQFMTSQTAAPVCFPIGRLVDILVRIMSMTAPVTYDTDNKFGSLRLDDRIGKEEREGLWSGLPGLHQAAIQVIQTCCERFGMALFPMNQLVIDQVDWIFQREKQNEAIRAAAYVTTAKLLDVSASTKSRTQVRQMSRMVEACCDDILPKIWQPTDSSESKTISKSNGHYTNKIALDPDSFLGHTKQLSLRQALCCSLRSSALVLLRVFLSKVPAQHISRSVRALMDRTAILSGDVEAMLASVLNPPFGGKLDKAESSILPLLARAYPDSLEIESLMRPRFPVIQRASVNTDGGLSDGDEDATTAAAENGYDYTDRSAASNVNISPNETPADGIELSSRRFDDVGNTREIAGPDVSNFDDPEAVNTTRLFDKPIQSNAEGAILDSRKRSFQAGYADLPDSKRARAHSEQLDVPFDLGMSASIESPIVRLAVDFQADREAEEVSTTVPAQGLMETKVDAIDNEDDDDFEIPELNLESDSEEDDDMEEDG